MSTRTRRSLVRSTGCIDHIWIGSRDGAAFAAAVLTVCGRVLADIRPAATIVVVSGLLRPEMRVEIEVTARIV